MNRRDFLKVLGAGTAAGMVLSPRGLTASEPEVGGKEFVGVLVDTTRCIGCRRCEEACAQAHGMPVPDIGDASVLATPRKTSVTQLTVVNRYATDRGDVFVKKQCMHCNQPACVAPCLVKAMEKKKEGPVIWNLNCMGCRICMVSCPFDIPKFEYDSATPRIQKCDLCWERLGQGQLPACVEACPQEALVFGTRRQLIQEAHKRISRAPRAYVQHIYGEREVGGSGFLYLSAVPFGQIGFRTDLGTKAYPEYTLGFLYSVPVILLLWPAFLLGLSTLTRRKEDVRKADGDEPRSLADSGAGGEPGADAGSG